MAEERRGARCRSASGAFILAGLVVFLAIIYLLGAQGALLRAQVRPVAEFARGGRAHRGRHRAAGRRADRPGHRRGAARAAGRQGAGDAHDRAALRRPHPARLGGEDRDPGPPGRQDRRDHHRHAAAPALKPGETRCARPMESAASCRGRDASSSSAAPLRDACARSTRGTLDQSRACIARRRRHRWPAALDEAPPTGPRGASPSRSRRARAGSTRWSTTSRRRSGG